MSYYSQIETVDSLVLWHKMWHHDRANGRVDYVTDPTMVMVGTWGEDKVKLMGVVDAAQARIDEANESLDDEHYVSSILSDEVVMTVEEAKRVGRLLIDVAYHVEAQLKKDNVVQLFPEEDTFPLD